jgi:hypothetical protein
MKRFLRKKIEKMPGRSALWWSVAFFAFWIAIAIFFSVHDVDLRDTGFRTKFPRFTRFGNMPAWCGEMNGEPAQ